MVCPDHKSLIDSVEEFSRKLDEVLYAQRELSRRLFIDNGVACFQTRLGRLELSAKDHQQFIDLLRGLAIKGIQWGVTVAIAVVIIGLGILEHYKGK